MVRTSFLLFVLGAFVFLSSGCVTVYADGCCPDKQAKKTAKVSEEKKPNMIKQADDWVRENLW
jgi:hypothetical protein